MIPAGKKHFENLDALRFIAFLLVFFSHGFFSWKYNGDSQILHPVDAFSHLGRLGVDFFFVLSSFLITWIILEEQEISGGFKARFFLIRRSLRIWPLYFLMVLLGYSVIALQQGLSVPTPHPNPSPLWFLFFVVNFYVVYHGDQFLFFLVFLWSIAIEEQFYFLWAFIMKWMKPFLLPACLILIAISLVFRYLNLHNSAALYYHTLSAVGNFGIGALLAHFAFQKRSDFSRLTALPGYLIGGVYLLFALLLVFYSSVFSSSILVIMERLIFSILFAFVIFEQSFCQNSIFKVGKWKPFSYLGKISYGLYCYHGVVITFLMKTIAHYKVEGAGLLQIAGAGALVFLLTVIISSVSYEFFEKKFLDVRTRFY